VSLSWAALRILVLQLMVGANGLTSSMNADPEIAAAACAVPVVLYMTAVLHSNSKDRAAVGDGCNAECSMLMTFRTSGNIGVIE
jgi:hypothetical protein